MGARGPSKKPTALKVLHGTARAEDLAAEPQPLEESPTPPEWFGEEHLAVWGHTLEQIGRTVGAFAIDRDALVSYTVAVVTAHEAGRLIARVGAVIKGGNGELRVNPAFGVWTKADAEQRAWGAAFGLTPGSRANFRAKDLLSSPDARAEAEAMFG